MSEQYNGWTNYETWNVGLWIGNDENLYNLALQCKDYQQFKEVLRQIAREPLRSMTPDKVAWDAFRVNEREVDAFLRELKGEEGEKEDSKDN